MSSRTSRRPNIPQPWPKAIDVMGKNIANLASAVGGVISGPTSTINPQRIVGSHQIDKARRLARRNRVSPERSRRLASMSLGNPELATLMPGTRYPSASQKRSERPLYTSLFTPERRSILSMGPFGIVKRVMGALGM